MSKKVALVSGASTGIGRAGCIRLAKEGWNLAIASRHMETLEECAELCRKEGAEVLVIQTDMSQENQVANMFAKTKEHYGAIDFYWSNQACIQEPKNFEDMNLDDFYLVSENNFKSTFLALVHGVNFFKEQGYGNILTTGSSSGIRPEAGFGVYSAAKHAVVGLTKDAAIECGRFNIRINCLCPGGFFTPMTDYCGKIFEKKGMFLRRTGQTLLPDRIMGHPDTEIAGMVAFLASDDAAYIQGAVISVDCGITL